MKIKLKTNFWQMKEYNMSVKKDVIFFSGEGEQLRLPLSELRAFSMTGCGDDSDTFILETETSAYEGCFSTQDDIKEFVDRLIEQGSYRIEMNLTSL